MRARFGRRSENLSEASGPLRRGSHLYRLIELAARSIARRRPAREPRSTIPDHRSTAAEDDTTCNGG